MQKEEVMHDEKKKTKSRRQIKKVVNIYYLFLYMCFFTGLLDFLWLWAYMISYTIRLS